MVVLVHAAHLVLAQAVGLPAQPSADQPGAEQPDREHGHRRHQDRQQVRAQCPSIFSMVMPTETRATTVPPSFTGTTDRIEGPSVP